MTHAISDGFGHISQRRWERFQRNKLAMASTVILCLLITTALTAPLTETWLGLDANSVDLKSRLQGPSLDHPLGTDDLGRDIFIRLSYGGQISLAVALFATLFSTVIGTAVGLLAGYSGGHLDSMLMRFTDGIISLPLLPLLIVLVALDLSKLGISEASTQSENIALYRIIFVIALFGWTTVARLVRAETLALKNQAFVLAAEALGASAPRIVSYHILPNIFSTIIVATTLSVGNIILLESVLSFLGMGIQPPTASWGNMLTGSQDLMWSSPQLAIWPGMMIFFTVISFNFFGDGLQEALDPKAS
ncbi:MAG: NAD synthetase [Rhodospirillaceae bacterium TMED8]|nr:NAD synthetase [Magnetovibrio sp.]OUT49062.1 MAG: NAD synthetase [Rhodospirillaceae bacterium TMED8]